jgi:hypothetical protein
MEKGIAMHDREQQEENPILDKPSQAEGDEGDSATVPEEDGN